MTTTARPIDAMDALIAERDRLVAALRRGPGRGSVADAIKKAIAAIDEKIAAVVETMGQREGQG